MDVTTRGSSARRFAGVLGATAALALLLAGPRSIAVAQDCPVADLTCVATGTVAGAGAVPDVGSTADDAQQTAHDAVSQATGDAQGVLDGLTGSHEPPGGGGGGDRGGGAGGGGGGASGGGGRNHGATSSGGGSRSIAGTSVLVREGGALLPRPTAAVRSQPLDSTNAHGPTTAAIRIREVATGLALPLLLVLAAVVVFIAVQDRLDRREPRLALAPMTGDVVTFG